LVLTALVGLLSVSASAATRLYYQGFETTGWESQFTGRSTWEDHVVRVSNAPRSGSYALRGNQNIWRIDPITGAYGLSNNLLDWRGGYDIATKTPNEMYFSYWFRHDDHTWAGSESGDGKLFYFVDTNYNTGAMYIGGQLANSNLTITYANGSYSSDWARLEENWGYSKLYLSHPNVSPSTSGQWRHFEYYINYNQHYFTFWIDGNRLIANEGRYPDGKLYYDSNLNIHWKGIQFFYIHAAQVDQSSDGTGYYNGWQIDDLEVWDGMPGTTPTVYTLTVNSGTGDGQYEAGHVAGIVADEAPSGQAFDEWIGDTSGIADTNDGSTTLTMPSADTEVTATYTGATTYTLTVNSGTGDGNYQQGQIVSITGDTAPSGQAFDEWTGDTANIANVSASSTTITMPAANAEITATYTEATLYTLTVNSGTGDGSYAQGYVVNISADAAASGYIFDDWSGDVSGVADVNDATTTLTMPAANAEITATYAEAGSEETIHFRQGGGSGYTDVTFDDTFLKISPATDDTYGTLGYNGIQADSSTEAALIAVKEMFTELPKTTNGNDINITEAKLHLFRYQGDGSATVQVYRMTTNWLPDSAGANENDVSGQHAEVSESTSWASGNFSTSDYDDTVCGTGPWSSVYNGEAVMDVTDVVEDIYDAGTNYGLCIKATAGILGRTSEYETASLRPSLEISYQYNGGATYTLTVNNGSGDGSYPASQVINISADAAPSGQAFDEWAGDTSGIANVDDPTTTITMPASNTEITATYTDVLYALTVNSGSGDGSYAAGTVVDISADAPASGTQFDQWTGDTSGIANADASSTTLTMPAAATEVTATYVNIYALTVNSGTGDGTYEASTVVNITADTAASGYTFNEWTGDTSGIADVEATSTTVTMPSADVEITASYAEHTELDVTSITASEYEDPNVPANTQDKSLQTRWSAPGYDGDWIKYDLGATKTVAYVKIAWYLGDQRTADFDIDISTNDSDWTQVYSSSSNGTSTALQQYDFTDVGARYVRVTGYGNSENHWNSITEVEIHGWAGVLYTLTVNSGSGDGDYPENEVVEISADSAPSGQLFYAWTGQVTSVTDINDSTTTVVMPTSDVEITADYRDVEHSLTVNSGSGDGDYAVDMVVDIDADAAPSGQEFDEWIGDTAGIASVTTADTTLTMPYADAEVTATYTDKTWTLTVNNGTGDGSYVVGAIQGITADAAPSGQDFDEWTGDVTGIADVDDPTTTITMPYSDAEITATYTDKTWTLTVNSGTGGGSYVVGAIQGITADAAPSGQDFDEWTGDVTGIADVNDSSTTITMPYADAEITATYTDKTWTLTVNSGTGGGSYVVGAVADIDADAAPSGQQFDEWVGDTVGIASVTTADTTLTMPYGNAEVTATYTDISQETIHFREGGGIGYTDVTFDDTYTDNYYENGVRGTSANLSVSGSRKHALLAIKGLFTELPKTTGGKTIVIESATLHLFRYNYGTSSSVLNIYRCTTDWLPDAAGANENDCCHEYAELSETTTWDSGDLSSADYDSANGVSGYWVDNYNEECELDVTDVIADIYDANTNYGMVLKSSVTIACRSSENSQSLRPSLEMTYYYE